MPTSRGLAVVGLALLLVAAGCSGGGGAGGDASRQLGAEETPVEAATEAATKAGDSAEFQARAVDRKLIRTAEVSLRVPRFRAAKSNLTAAVRASGGYVARVEQHTEEVGNQTYTEGTIVLRVPKGNFSGVMRTIERQGTVRSKQVTTKDVTQQYVDLKARLKNLKRERARLRELYEQANDTEAVLKVQARLSEVQGQIEQIQGRLQVLRNRIAYATITVHLHEPRPEPEPPDEDHWYETGVVAAFMESVGGVVTVARAIVVGFAYALPYLLVVGVPAIGALAVYRSLDWRP